VCIVCACKGIDESEVLYGRLVGSIFYRVFSLCENVPVRWGTKKLGARRKIYSARENIDQ